LRDAVTDPLLLERAMMALRRYSLVERAGESFSVHRLVQAVTRDRLAGEDRGAWAEAAIRVVNRAFPYDSDDVRTWPECARLLSHALTAVDHAEALGVGREELGRLLNQLGVYARGRALF